MTLVGQYDATHTGATGTLFVYGESPVESSKLNRWHGNIAAGLWTLNRAARLLGGEGGVLYLLGDTADSPFLVEEQATPDMTVKVRSGIALGPTYVIGSDAVTSIPAAGPFVAPTTNPRIDAIGVDESGNWVVLTGTEDASPTAPTLSADTVPLAEVYFRVGATSIKDIDDSTNAYLIDRRPSRLPTQAHRHEGPAQPAETTDGARTNFSTATTFLAGTLRVYVNGLQQLPTTHYAEDGDLIGYTFVTAPPASFVVHHEYQPA